LRTYCKTAIIETLFSACYNIYPATEKLVQTERPTPKHTGSPGSYLAAHPKYLLYIGY